MINFHKKHSIWRYLVVLTLLAAAIIISLLIVKNETVSESLAPYFTKKPDPLTELYFANYDSIPKLLNAGNNYPISFTIVNHENGDHTYQYRVTVIENSKTSVIGLGKVFIRNGEETQKEIFYRPSQPGAKDEIIVDLVDKRQEITFSAHTN